MAAAATLRPGASASATRVVIGHSAHGRAILARGIGDPHAARRILVVGCIHGTERAGLAVTRALRRVKPPRGAMLWLVDEVNPDGCRAGTRQNARGVDLNRNSTWRWKRSGHPFSTYYSGPRALSEPESRAIRAFVRRERPAVTIFYHQHARLVDYSGGDKRIERRYARLVGLPFRRYIRPRGSITSWQNATFRKATAFVVELAAGRLSKRAVGRHVRAVLDLARLSPAR